jgi:hypothetical protein
VSWNQDRVTVRCDLCPAEHHAGWARLTAVQAQKLARIDGWRRDKLGRDICPAHRKLKGAKR